MTIKPKKNEKVIIGYKGFNKDLTCKGYEFKVGEVESIPTNRAIKLCNTGFHACRKLSDVNRFYNLKNSSYEFCKVMSWGDIKEETGGNAKYASRHIKILRKLTSKEIATQIKKIEEAEVKQFLKEITIVNKTKPFVSEYFDYNQIIVVKKQGSILWGFKDTRDENHAIIKAKNVTVIGNFESYEGVKGTTIIDSSAGKFVIDGKKYKAGVKYTIERRNLVPYKGDFFTNPENYVVWE